MKILVAEDDRITALLVRNKLETWGYEPTLVETGAEALEILSGDDPPPMVLLDWMLPDVSGPAICRHIRDLHRNQYTYIIMLSGRELTEDLIAGMNAGADDYIIKPFNPDELKARLQSGERILQQEADLRALLTRMQESGKMRDRFIAGLTHDLRTPLNAQRMTLEVLANKCRNANQMDCVDLVEAIAESNQDMLKLVNHMLEACHLESEQDPFRKTPINLFELVEQSCAVLVPLAEEKEIRLHNLIPREVLPNLTGDAQQIRRVLNNLIGNAINHIQPGCQVDIIGYVQDEAVHVQIRDNGPGIPADILPHLFDRYYTGTGRFPRKVGTGLGLSICKSIVEQHGGIICVKSVLGQGACFEFTLPLPTSAGISPEAFRPGQSIPSQSPIF